MTASLTLFPLSLFGFNHPHILCTLLLLRTCGRISAYVSSYLETQQAFTEKGMSETRPQLYGAALWVTDHKGP